MEQKPVTRFELLMDAGFGAQKAGDILIRVFAKAGKYVYIEPMIPAEISPPPRSRPALSGVIIRVADFDITNIGNNTDLILASHEIVLDRRLDDEETNPSCRVLLDMGDRPQNEESYERVLKRVTKLGLSVIPFEIPPQTKEVIRSLGGRGTNMFYLGMLSAIYNMPREPVEEEIRRVFAKLKPEILDKNIAIFSSGYDYARENIPFVYDIIGTPHHKEPILIDGNTALAMGMIDAGIKFYSGYPITPASSIMHTLARYLPHYGGFVHQAEDEIAAIGAAIGAYFGGTPAATGTSGPGLSLKQEFIGYATAIECPLIIIDAQRGGPSTGLPTKTEQADLPAVLFGCHGDNTKIVISVANVFDCFYAPTLARYLAEKLRMPVFIMTDFQTANNYKIVENFQLSKMGADVDAIPDFVLERFRIGRLDEPIEYVRDNQSVPGTAGGMRRVTGLNSDRTGSVNYFAKTNQRAHRIRNEKVHHVRRVLKEPEMFGPPEGDALVVGWGSTRGAIEEAVTNARKEGLNVSGMHLRIVYPLPPMLKDIFQRFKYVATAELAYGDRYKPPPLMMLLRSETLCDVQSLVAQATGRPIRPAMIKNKLQELVESGTVT